MTDLVLRSLAGLSQPAPTTPRQMDKTGRGIMNQGSLDILRDNVNAAVASNHMCNTASLYSEAQALCNNDPTLAGLLFGQVQQFAVKRA